MNAPLKAMPSPAEGVVVNEPVEQQIIQTIDFDLGDFQLLDCKQFLPNQAENS